MNFELSNYDVAVKHFSNLTTKTPSNIFRSISTQINKEETDVFTRIHPDLLRCEN